MAAWSHRAADADLARRLAVALGVSEPVATVLARLGPDEAEAERHLRPQLAHVSDPFAVGGLRAAAERLVQAAAAGERIAILGDYDVDGVSSTAMLVHCLRRLGSNPAYFVPRRMEEGYGLSMAALDRVLAEARPQVFVALDCGTNSLAEVARLRAEGVEVIVVDHHVAKDGHAVCTLVNPRVNDPVDAPWQSLCTAGLVFKLIHGILKVLRLAGDDRGTSIAVKDYLDLAALGTIADLVPLRAENRILASHGLRALGEARRPGLRGFAFDRPPTPFGEGNFRHQLALPGGRRLNFVAWRMASRLPEPGRPVELAVRLQWNRWQGRRLPQAEILDWRYAG